MRKKSLNKKMLIISIAVIILIVLTSFTSVVGFKTPKTASIKISPLFSIRIERAIEQIKSKIITTEYIGKEKPATIPFPTKNNTIIIVWLADVIEIKQYPTFKDL